MSSVFVPTSPFRCAGCISGGKKFSRPAGLSWAAFRFQPVSRTAESILQTGVECMGLSDRKAADIEVLSLAVEGVRAAGLKSFSLKIGDLTLFAGLIDVLDIPRNGAGA